MEKRGKNFVDISVIIVLLLLLYFYIFHYHIPKIQALPKYAISVYDADGLIIGSPVLFNNEDVGMVTNLTFEDNKTIVTFRLDRPEMKEIPPNCEIRIKSSGLAGSRALEIYQFNESQKENLVIHEPIRQDDINNVQINMAKLTINTANFFSAMFPNKQISEFQKNAREKFHTDHYLEIFDKIIKQEEQFQNEIDNNKLKNINKKLEK